MKIKSLFSLLAILVVACGTEATSQNTTITSSSPLSSSSFSSSTNLFNVNFDSVGGSIVSSQNVEPNSLLVIPSASREGYTLEGWYTSINGGQTLDNKWNFFTDRVNFNFTLYAKWTINQYTITFNSNGGTSVVTQTNNYNSALTIPTPTKTGYTFGGWFTDVGLTQGFTLTNMPASNLTLNAKWTINQYTITFNTNGGTAIASITGDYAFAIDVPANPTREGYTFAGWYRNITLTESYSIPSTMPASNLTLYAKWIEIFNSFQMNGTYGFLTSQSRIFSWGYNASGSIGDGTTINRSRLVEISQNFDLFQDENIVQYKTSYSNSAALTSVGRVFVWGTNLNGEIGDGTYVNRLLPTDITTNFSLNFAEKIVSIYIGSQNIAALSSQGRLFMWGYNPTGSIGDGTKNSRNLPIDITPFFNLEENETIQDVNFVGYSSFALSSSGRFFSWGLNFNYELGSGNNFETLTPNEITMNFNLTENEKIVSISHQSVLTNAGRLFTWGSYSGDGTENQYSLPKDITSQFVLVQGEKIIKINRKSALTNFGRLFTWGLNSNGTIGDGTQSDRLTPIDITPYFSLLGGETIESFAIGWSHSYALTSHNRLFMWGSAVGESFFGDGKTIYSFYPKEMDFWN